MCRLALLVLSTFIFSLPAHAAGQDPVKTGEVAQAPLVTRNPFQPLPPLREKPNTRPAALVPLYVSFAGLQAYDGYTTTIGLNHGAREANPLLGALADKPAVLWAIKGGVTAGSIYAAERLWRKRRRAEAIIVMIASNGVMAAVAARNTTVTQLQR